MDYIHLVQDKDLRQAVVTVTNVRIPYNDDLGACLLIMRMFISALSLKWSVFMSSLSQNITTISCVPTRALNSPPFQDPCWSWDSPVIMRPGYRLDDR